jgi:hypothetical protein
MHKIQPGITGRLALGRLWRISRLWSSLRGWVQFGRTSGKDLHFLAGASTKDRRSINRLDAYFRRLQWMPIESMRAHREPQTPATPSYGTVSDGRKRTHTTSGECAPDEALVADVDHHASRGRSPQRGVVALANDQRVLRESPALLNTTRRLQESPEARRAAVAYLSKTSGLERA